MYATPQKRASVAYARMLEISEKTGLPIRFRTDLTKHDRQAVSDHGGEPFAWYLYDSGTHIVWPDGRRRGTGDLVLSVTQAGNGSWYIWNGQEMVQASSPETVTAFLTDGEE